jgi:hypothetical protein
LIPIRLAPYSFVLLFAFCEPPCGLSLCEYGALKDLLHGCREVRIRFGALDRGVLMLDFFVRAPIHILVLATLVADTLVRDT